MTTKTSTDARQQTTGSSGFRVNSENQITSFDQTTLEPVEIVVIDCIDRSNRAAMQIEVLASRRRRTRRIPILRRSARRGLAGFPRHPAGCRRTCWWPSRVVDAAERHAPWKPLRPSGPDSDTWGRNFAGSTKLADKWRSKTEGERAFGAKTGRLSQAYRNMASTGETSSNAGTHLVWAAPLSRWLERIARASRLDSVWPRVSACRPA
jgi:hypothetical protein